MSSEILAGDIGGTKTLLGLFAAGSPRPPLDDARGGRERVERPRQIVAQEFGTLDFPDLSSMIQAFFRTDAARGGRPDRACFGVAGPVVDQTAELTNVPWRVDARDVARAFDLRHVTLMNDLQAMAASVPVLETEELHVLQEGRPRKGGAIAVIAAGTGLGEALLHQVDGRFVPLPSEGGHADFPARDEREFALTRSLIAQYGRAEVEQVVSGRGFVHLHPIAHRSACTAGVDLKDPDAPAAISQAGLERRCAGCVETLEMFVDAYGAEAGNIALKVLATGGVFIGGGIAPKILPALAGGAFMRAFTAKPPMEDLLRVMPVKVILNERAGLIGAAVHVQQEMRR